MKENIDILSALAGGAGALIKGRRRKRKLKVLILDMIVGVILGYTSIGLLDYFMIAYNVKAVILVSYVVGYLTNELTDLLESLVKKADDVIIGWVSKDKPNSDAESENKEENEPEI